MSGNGKIQRDEVGGMALTRILVKEMIGTENFWWSEENYCDSRHLRGNIDGFLRDGKSGNINRNTNWSRCDICVQNVESAGSAGPRGPATWTDSDDFFFLERASLTPTWIRPLY